VIKADLTGPALFALTDSSQLEAALMNLAINARDAMPAGGILTIRTGSASAGQARQAGLQDFGDYIVIAVSDTGQGMTEEVRSRAFEPYFTTKEIDKGTGLGLSMVYGLAKQSGGAGTVESAVGKGTTVFLYLPRAERPPTVADRSAQDEELDGGPASRILVVDDDDAVRDITSALLKDFGHEVIGAESGDVALELLKRDRCFQLLIVDMMMPNMHGAVFAVRARALLPEVPALFVTGYADSHSMGETPNDHILRKPFRRDALAEKLRDSLGNR
jgi:CheY-like chemotaxis protein